PDQVAFAEGIPGRVVIVVATRISGLTGDGHVARAVHRPAVGAVVAVGRAVVALLPEQCPSRGGILGRVGVIVAACIAGGAGDGYVARAVHRHAVGVVVA